MADEDIKITVSAVDKATVNLKKVSSSLGNITGKLNETVASLTGFNAAQLSIAGSVVLVTEKLMEVAKETQAYNLTVVDLARKMGTTTEEASRLAQIGDDVRLSQEQISTAMTFAIRNGLEPNIEGLAKLADKYNALKTPVERGQLLLETFGRSGMDMAKLMEKGGDGVRSMSAAIEDNLIVTKEAADASQKWYEAQDKISDQMTGIKMQIGNEMIPWMIKLADVQDKYTELRKADADGINSQSIPILNIFANTVMSIEAAYQTLIGTEKDATKTSISGLKQIEGIAKSALGALSKENEEAIKGIAQFEKLYETGNEKITELYGQRSKLENDLQILRSQGYSDEGQNIKEVVEKMGEVDAAIQKTKDEFDKATNQIIFDYSLQMLAADGLKKEEMEGMLEWGKSVDLFSQNAVDAFNSAMAKSKELSDSIQNMPDKTINVNVVTRQYSEDYRSRGIEGGLIGRGYANGANFTVPSGYPNDSFPMRVQSGEHVQVTPKGKSASSGNINVYLNYAPLVSLSDRAEAEQKLVPYIEAALRKVRK